MLNQMLEFMQDLSKVVLEVFTVLISLANMWLIIYLLFFTYNMYSADVHCTENCKYLKMDWMTLDYKFVDCHWDCELCLKKYSSLSSLRGKFYMYLWMVWVLSWFCLFVMYNYKLNEKNEK